MIVWMLFTLALAGGPADMSEREAQRASCELGVARDCTSLGLRYRDGRGAPEDPHFALDLFGKGCELGDATACVYRADAYRNGDGVSRDPNRALELYLKACSTENLSRACRALGEIYILGDGVPRDPAISGTWYEQACLLGDAESCVGAALAIERGDMVEADPERGREMLSQACEMHHARACTLLGLRYERGSDGAEKDVQLAETMFNAGCALQDPEGCRMSGYYAWKGKNNDADFEVAKLHLTSACAWEDYEACRFLSKIFRKEKNLDGAIRAAQRGCELGQDKACALAERLEYRAALIAEHAR